MSDEEKNAIEDLKEVIELYNDECLITTEDDFKSIEILLNLIEKQSKEIEELKNITKSYDSFLGTEKIVIADKKFFVNGYFRENYVSKDKIKAKIEESELLIDNSQGCMSDKDLYKEYGKIEFGQSLLEKE